MSGFFPRVYFIVGELLHKDDVVTNPTEIQVALQAEVDAYILQLSQEEELAVA